MISTFKGEDRNPVFGADGDTFYFLSEQDGKTSNIFCSSVSHPENQVQLTFYDKNPVRFLSVAQDGTVAYSYNGDLYTLKGGKVNITLSSIPSPSRAHRPWPFRRTEKKWLW